MTHLRKMMLEELERRNYAQTTIDCYLRVVAEFSLHFHRPPNQFDRAFCSRKTTQLKRPSFAPSPLPIGLAVLRRSSSARPGSWCAPAGMPSLPSPSPIGPSGPLLSSLAPLPRAFVWSSSLPCDCRRRAARSLGLPRPIGFVPAATPSTPRRDSPCFPS
jgi:hypothetical protein